MKKLRVTEYAMLQSKKVVRHKHMNSSQIGTIGSSGTIGLNPAGIMKAGPKHHRGNSDGNSQMRNTGHHKRKSSGSNTYLRTFEENID